ncbi:protein SENESCENCE-ASSOCIATED GENE 21, mitochondrial [Sorghum bicolor]|uniref:protein SENESCENCE-ASSOCIATED GENE 21, mitochondrial n=1 Tax=Sorghum bicolor TaxID=4558 RepID=UPI0001A85855|nr:protein SENESCENCE-ASSOCIATED GENE 21, mitochondrial [Sorghum bicolor]|eukprot:XP_002452301.1 protein SENESCENCE-ASSOCIATED GENE 21, mitochondrial [Sorghum bicolor]
MPRAAVTTLLSLSRRRGYAAAAEVRVRAPAAAMAARAPGAGGAADGASSSKEVFWMRDPQTGCWAPEDRFADVDAAELRARLLARKD